MPTTIEVTIGRALAAIGGMTTIIITAYIIMFIRTNKLVTLIERIEQNTRKEDPMKPISQPTPLPQHTINSLGGDKKLHSLIILLIILFFLLLTVNALALTDTTATKLCNNLNLTISECNELLNEMTNTTQVVTQVNNITNNITQNVTIIQREIMDKDLSGYALKTDLEAYNRALENNYDAKIKTAEATIKTDLIDDLYKYIETHPIKETVTINSTINPDDYVTSAKFAQYLNGQNQQNNNTPQNDTLLYIAGAVVLGLVGYTIYKKQNRREPASVYQQPSQYYQQPYQQHYQVPPNSVPPVGEPDYIHHPVKRV